MNRIKRENASALSIKEKVSINEKVNTHLLMFICIFKKIELGSIVCISAKSRIRNLPRYIMCFLYKNKYYII